MTDAADRAILIKNQAGFYVYERGPYRAKVWRRPDRRWHWCVRFADIMGRPNGATPYGEGTTDSLRTAREVALRTLYEAAQITSEGGKPSMKTLSEAQKIEVAETVTRLRTLAANVEQEIERFNDAIAEHHEAIEEAVREYNEAVQGAAVMCEGFGAEMQDYFDGRSEKWQEGDKGQAYLEWMREWGEGLPDADVESPTTLELPDLDAAEQLEGRSIDPE